MTPAPSAPPPPVVPWTAPGRQYEAYREEIDAAVARVLAGGRYVLGPEVEAFEREFAAWLGPGMHAVGVGSGTEALHAALVACGVGPGDEVITVSHTAVATAAAVLLAGARPVFAEVDPETLTLDPDALADALTPACRAVVAVHLYGQAVDLEPVAEFTRAHGLALVEDCAQAHGTRYRGARVGTFGDAAAFSFYPTKNLGAVGDGGMVTTPRRETAEQVRLLREYGWRERYVSSIPGWNTRLDELQAAVLRVKLRHLDEEVAARRRLAAFYDRELPSRLRRPATLPGREHSYHLYVVRSQARDRLRAHLAARGVGSGVHYPVPVHQQPAYARFARAPLPRTERAAAEVLSLPMHAHLTPAEAARVVEAVREFRP